MPHGGADNTQKILDVLADYGVKATFFVVGNWADQYPEQAKAIVESGNELMNHSNAHDHYNSLTADRIIADVNTCNDKIEALTGVRPTLLKARTGLLTPPGMTRRASSKSLSHWLWLIRVPPLSSSSRARGRSS